MKQLLIGAIAVALFGATAARAGADEASEPQFRADRLIKPVEQNSETVEARTASLPVAVTYGYAYYPTYAYTYAYPYSWLWPAYSYAATGYYYAAPSYYYYPIQYYPFAYYSQPYYGYTPYSWSVPTYAAYGGLATTTYAYYGPWYGSGFWIGLGF